MKTLQTIKQIVAAQYVLIRDNDHYDATFVKGQVWSEKSVSFEDIDTNRFMFNVHYNLRDFTGNRIKETTVERYLRKFRAIDRNLTKLEQPLASVSKLNASS